MFDRVIVDGCFATPTGIVEGWLAISQGAIAALGTGAAPGAHDAFNAHGALVLPGGIDTHVHFRDPGLTHKEDFATGSAAAACGGVTTIFDMPNTKPPVMTPVALEAKRRIAESKSCVDFGLVAAVDASNLAQLSGLAECGAVAFEVFMYTPGAAPPAAVADDGSLGQVLTAIAQTGRPANVHAESDTLVRYFSGQVKAAGRCDPRAHLDARPTIVEVEGIERALLLTSETGVHLHLCHVTSGRGAYLVRIGKARGLRLTADTGPQNLLLDDSYYERLGPRIKMTPPIRTTADANQLWEGLLDGTIDILASDHAPHTAEEKSKDDIFAAASGFVGVETTLPLMLTQVHAGRLTIAQLNRIRSEMPARIFGLFPRKGVIEVGADADLVIVDREHEWTIRCESLHSRTRVTPFDGWPVKGAVVTTIVRGNIVYQGGRIVREPVGRMVRPLT